jgi:PAS domain S-box-containing protein
VLSFSLGAEKIFGYTAKEIIGQKVALLHPPEEIGNFQTMQQALRNDKKGFSGEATLIRKSGEHFPGLFTLHPLHNDTGEMIGTLGVTIDIKERKRLENIQAVQLRLIEYASGHTIDELLQKLLDEAETLTGSEIGFYHFVDDDQTNLSLQSWSTNTKEKMCTENIDDRHYPINQAGVWVDCVHQRRPVIHNDYASLPHKKGIPEGHAPIIRELVVPVIRGEKIVAILGVGNKKENYGQEDAKTIQLLADLAWETIVQKQAANELRESNSRYSDLIEKMSSGFALHKVVYAKNGTVEDYLFLDMNTAFEALTGLKRAETIGKTVRQVLPQTEGFWIERFGEVALTGVPKHFNDYSKALGKYYDVTAYCPAPQQFATIINDISDQKMAEDEIGRLNDELEERVKQRTAELELSNQELEAFSYSVSHDLRAPLRAINGKAGMLEEELAGMSSAPARKHLRSIRKSSQMMGQLVDDLILYARLSKLVSKSDTVNLDDIVQSCWKESAAEREGRNIDFQSSMLPPCHGDRAMLKQLIINLMSNAVKYTGSREQAIIEIGSREEDGKTVYFMRDNGIGFDMRYIDKLFNVFQRLHREDEYEGTGIGLSLAKRIVERHGGRIWAEGEVGKGATFYFTLEASHPSQP